MLIWFVGLSVVLVWVVFQSPALDVRTVAIGSLVPWLDAVTGGPFVLHTLLGSVGLMAVVMLGTRNHRQRRRAWLGVPIGMFMHLILDATWTRSSLFWWPGFGHDGFAGRLPEFERGLGLNLALELAGVVALIWLWKGFGLDDPDRREALRSSGRLRPK